ncbi:DUF4083 domain-containing protein [Alteribacillus bidgolensis]|uniref:DUF4083 domain-containing protein n=1 Tax=Alteribacillus bidgolensis TaxID=930129 RepID=A0A1G8NKG2_9BACI|nr:DUF4083 domain-containing protein [Alteribacillus bidgolensis]SDI79990.1 protein of unknown function [Alteribacillus bidgolensis]
MSLFYGDLIFSVVILMLIILFAVSFTLFVRRLIINLNRKYRSSNKVEEKLDRIIELLEKDK